MATEAAIPRLQRVQENRRRHIRELNKVKRLIRQIWGINPQTKVKASKKIYKRFDNRRAVVEGSGE